MQWSSLLIRFHGNSPQSTTGLKTSIWVLFSKCSEKKVYSIFFLSYRGMQFEISGFNKNRLWKKHFTWVFWNRENHIVQFERSSEKLDKLKTQGTQMGDPIGVLIYVVTKINDQTIFWSILATQRPFNSLANLPFVLSSFYVRRLLIF